MRISEQDAIRLGIIPNPKAVKKSRNKYNAKKAWVDGILFDSNAEADYYCKLKLLLRAGEITGFCRQARFVITEGINGERGTEYVTDFIIFYPNGNYRIVDVKGKVLKDDNYSIIASHDGSRVLYDKFNPRTEVYIERMGEK